MQHTILVISSAYKGIELLKELHAQGCRVLFLTKEELRDEAWPYESIDEIFFMPDLRRYQDITNAVSFLAREQKIDQIIPLDEFEVEITAILREHLRLPGMALTATRKFRDKLAMREVTKAAGLPCPEFCSTIHRPTLAEYLDRVPAPWMLKPRMEAGSIGIKKCQTAQELWDKLNELGDMQSHYLVEQFIPGDVFHVDSVIADGKIHFCSVQKYGAPPINVYQGGGVFNSRVLDRDSDDAKALRALSTKLVEGMDYKSGIAHAEFIKSHATGDYYFLEVAARVGGAFISDLIEKATDINPWREWARLELAKLRGETYQLPPMRDEYGGLIITLAKQQRPDLSAYNDPEIVWKPQKDYHAGLIMVSPDAGRIESLLADYTTRFVQDFLAVGRPEDVSQTGHTG